MANGSTAVTPSMIQNRPALPVYNEVSFYTPVTFSVTTGGTAQPLFAVPYKWVTSFVIRVRSLGTSTYIRVGNSAGQNYTLAGVGSLYQFSCNPREIVNLAGIWIISDTTDAVLEIVASYLPLALYGNVNIALNQS
jgi:hypothetical protein